MTELSKKSREWQKPLAIVVSALMLLTFFSHYNWFLRSLSWPLYNYSELLPLGFTIMMATISFHLATRSRNDKGKVFDELFVGQLAIAIFSIYVVFQSTVGFFKTEPLNSDPLSWSWMIGSESWKVDSEIIDLRASLSNIDLKSERGKAKIEELVRLEAQALRLKRLDAVESQFNQDKIVDATEMAFRNASKDRYLPVAFLVLFHCSLIWRRLI